MIADPFSIVTYGSAVTFGALAFFSIGERLLERRDRKLDATADAVYDAFIENGERDDYEDFTARDGQVVTGRHLFAVGGGGQLIDARDRFAARRATGTSNGGWAA